MAAARRGWRRIARWAIKILLLLLALLVVLIGVAVGLLHTDWGRNQLREQLVARVSARLNGNLEVARVSGSVLGHLELEGVVIRDQTGTAVVEARSLSLEYAPSALLNKHISVEAIELDGVSVAAKVAPDGSVNLSDLLQGEEEPDERAGGGSDWELTIGRISVTDSTLVIARASGSSTRITEIDIGLSDLSQTGGHLGVRLDHATARWAEIPMGLAVSGEAYADDGAVGGRLSVRVGDSTIDAPAVFFDNEGTLRAEGIRAHVASKDLRAISSAHPGMGAAGDLLVDVDATASLTRPGADLPLRFNVALTAGDSDLTLAGEVDLQAGALSGTVVSRSLRPAAVIETAPDSDIALELRVDLRGSGRSDLSGRLSGELDGRLGSIDGAHMSIDLEAIQSRVTGSFTTSALGATASTEVVARLDADPVYIDRLDVEGDIGPLATLVPPGAEVRVRGPVTVSVHASGPVNALAAGGTVGMGDVSAGNHSMASGTLRFDASGIPSAVAGSAELRMYDVRTGAMKVGQVAVTASSPMLGEGITLSAAVGARTTEFEMRVAAYARRSETATELTLKTFHARLRDLVISGRGGHVMLDARGRLVARGVRLSSAAGHLSADGDLRRGLRVRLTSVDLAALAAAAASRADLSGHVNLDATFYRRNKSYGAKVVGTATAVSLHRGMSGVDGSFSVTVEPNQLALDADFDGGSLGRGHIDVTGRAPSDPTNTAAWLSLAPRIARHGHLLLEDVQVAGALAAARRPTQASGRINANLTLSNDGDSVDGTIDAAGVRFAGLGSSVGGTITIAVGNGQATLDSKAAMTGVGTVAVTGRARVPARLTDVAAWRELSEQSVASLELTTSQILLHRLGTHVQGIPQLAGLGGTASVRITANDRAEHVAILVTTRGLTGEISRLPVDLVARTDIRRDTAVATIRGGFRGSPQLSATARVDVGMRALRAPTYASLQQVAIRGTADLARQDLRVISEAIVPLAGVFAAGSVTLRATFRGTVANPSGQVRIAFDKPSVAGVSFANVAVHADVSRMAVSGSVTAHQEGGGQMLVRARVDPGSIQSLDASLFARRFDLSFASGLLLQKTSIIVDKGPLLDGRMSVAGTLARPAPSGSLRLSGARLRATGLARPLTDLDMEATFVPGTISLRADTRSARGSAHLSGKVTVDGLQISEGILSARARRFPVLAGDMILAVDAEATTKMTSTRKQLDIAVEIDRAVVIVPLQSTHQRVLHPIGDYPDIVFVDEAADTDATADDSRRDGSTRPIRLALRAPDTIVVRGEEINATVDVDLVTRILPTGSSTTGTVTITRGHLELFGRRYDFDKANVSFDGSVPPDPHLDLKLAHSFGDVTVSILVAGRLSAPKLTFAAEPDIYDQSTLLAIVLGQDPGDPESNDSIDNRAINIASGLLIDQLRRQIDGGLPVDVLRFEEDTTESGRTSQRIVVGMWLTDDLFVAYNYRTESDVDDNSNRVQVEYRLSKRWRIESTYGDAGKGGVDLLWVKRY